MSEHEVRGGTEGGNWTHLIEALERKRSISALLYLGRNGRVKEIQIRDDVFPNPQQTEAQLRSLKDVGLVDYERDEVDGSRRTAKFWSLTMRGEAVESMLRVMELCAEGDLSPVRVIQACRDLEEEAERDMSPEGE